MNFKQYMEQNKAQLPPNLDAGMEFARIDSVTTNEFNTPEGPVKGMRVFTDKGEYKTSSKVIMEILSKYFEANKEAITNVRIIAPRGKRYLTLEGF